MLAYKLKKKRDRQTTEQVDSQWKALLEHFEESENLASVETTSNANEEPVQTDANASKTDSVATFARNKCLGILVSHCFAAVVVGSAVSITGMVSTAIAGAYLTGTFTTCGFVGLELFRIRTTQ